MNIIEESDRRGGLPRRGPAHAMRRSDLSKTEREECTK